MEYSNDKNVTYGIKNTGDKFRGVRNKATKEYVSKRKKKKDHDVVPPKFFPGQEIVIVRDGARSPKKYCLVDVVDFEAHHDGYKYYCIVRETTCEQTLERIGRFIMFNDYMRFGGVGWQYGKVKNENIRWIEK